MFGAFAGVELRGGGQVHSAPTGGTFSRHFTMVYEGRTETVTISDDERSSHRFLSRSIPPIVLIWVQWLLFSGIFC